jgi:hypothetical protein
MSEREPADRDPGAIGGRAPEDEDPARRPVEEAGGGEAEGFEQAEEDLREHAEHGDQGPNPVRAAFTPEEESDLETTEHGEPDRVRSSERPEED